MADSEWHDLYAGITDKHCVFTLGDLLKYLEGNEECIHLCIIALSIKVAAGRAKLTVLFNNEAYHSPSLSLAVLDNILFMSLSGADASITVFNKPQPRPTSKEWPGCVFCCCCYLLVLLLHPRCILPTLSTSISETKMAIGRNLYLPFVSSVGVPMGRLWPSKFSWARLFWSVAFASSR